jgi:hypothetical protein
LTDKDIPNPNKKFPRHQSLRECLQGLIDKEGIDMELSRFTDEENLKLLVYMYMKQVFLPHYIPLAEILAKFIIPDVTIEPQYIAQLIASIYCSKNSQLC